MERNRQLTHLNLAYCSVTPVSLAIVLNKHGTRLQKLNLRGCCATDEYLGPQLQSCRKLVRLDLSHCSRLTDKTLAHIANSCPCLEKLFLRDCWRVTAVGLISLAHGCTQLMCIDIKNCNVSGTLFVPRKTSIPLEVLR